MVKYSKLGDYLDTKLQGFWFKFQRIVDQATDWGWICQGGWAIPLIELEQLR